MANSAYFRRQASMLREWARACFDLKTVENLRRMAAEFEARASQEDYDDEGMPPAYMTRDNGRNGGDMDRD